MIAFTFIFTAALFAGVGYICIPEFVRFLEQVIREL